MTKRLIRQKVQSPTDRPTDYRLTDSSTGRTTHSDGVDEMPPVLDVYLALPVPRIDQHRVEAGSSHSRNASAIQIARSCFVYGSIIIRCLNQAATLSSHHRGESRMAFVRFFSLSLSLSFSLSLSVFPFSALPCRDYPGSRLRETASNEPASKRPGPENLFSTVDFSVVAASGAAAARTSPVCPSRLTRDRALLLAFGLLCLRHRAANCR
jgi:hypothetical protein